MITKSKTKLTVSRGGKSNKFYWYNLLQACGFSSMATDIEQTNSHTSRFYEMNVGRIRTVSETYSPKKYQENYKPLQQGEWSELSTDKNLITHARS